MRWNEGLAMPTMLSPTAAGVEFCNRASCFNSYPAAVRGPSYSDELSTGTDAHESGWPWPCLSYVAVRRLLSLGGARRIWTRCASAGGNTRVALRLQIIASSRSSDLEGAPAPPFSRGEHGAADEPGLRAF